MKKLLSLLIFSFTLLQLPSYAQFSRYIIRLKDKQGNGFSIGNPIQFLSQRAIDRRIRYGIAVDETDLPVSKIYLDSLLSIPNVTVLNKSKWFNQICIKTTDPAAIVRINAMPFVIKTVGIAARPASSAQLVNKLLDPVYTNNFPIVARPQSPTDVYNYGRATTQIQLNNTQFLHNYSFSGNGMQMAVMDAGFYHYQTLAVFDSLRNNNQILGTWDFVDNKESVNEEFYHGMQCLSTMAANQPGSFVGTAPNTSFYLYRTEDVASEYPIEEQNFVAAAERADSAGVDIFSVSLGYNKFDNAAFNYTYADMNGQTTLIARGADMAARKGILMAAAAGNDGDKPWHYISTPADADSVLTVGAVDINKTVANFSSFGPSNDGQVKPDVAAVGVGAVVSNTSGQPSYNNGTSFACPIVAGAVSCLWQAFPEVNNMEIIAAARKSGDRFLNPDDRTGYGIADMKKAFVLLEKKLFSKDISINSSCSTVINWQAKAATKMNFVIERKMPADADFVAIDTQQYIGNFSMQRFTFSDDLTPIAPGISIAYRIKMNIGVDTSFYLDSATLNYNSSCVLQEEKIIISPNPVSDKLRVSISKKNLSQVSIIVHAALGSKIFELNNQPVIGEKIFTIPTNRWSSGTYFVSVFIDNKKVETKKIIRE